MKKYPIRLWGMLLCLLLSITSNAQSDDDFVTYFVRIPNPADTPTVMFIPGIHVSFNDPAIDIIASNYTFRQFHKAFPNSTTSGFTDLYLVEVNSAQFISDLTAANPSKYTYSEMAKYYCHYITLDSPSYAPSYSFTNNQPVYTFSSSELTTAVADYSIRQFMRAYPLSNDPSRTNIYIVEAATYMGSGLTYKLPTILTGFGGGTLFRNPSSVVFRPTG